MTWLDYKHIKASVSFLDVLAYYGIELRQTGKHHLAGRCPLPNHAGDRSNTNAFHVDLVKNAYNCFTHCGGGNIIDFVANMENCEFREAALKLHQNFFIDSVPVQAPEPVIEKQSAKQINEPLSFELKGLKPIHPFLLKEKKLTQRDN